MVNKTFLDESGFMVTKKEYVSCSESEEEVGPEVKPEMKPEVTQKVTVKNEKLENPAPKANTKQASIKNFFVKKQ